MRSASTIPDDASSTVWNPRVRARRAEELDALSAELDELAKPLAAYLLMWLYANPDPGWDRRGRRQW